MSGTVTKADFDALAVTANALAKQITALGARVIVPVVPPVVVPGKQVANVVKVGSLDWIIRADGIRLDITSTGTILYGGLPVPGSQNSTAVGYDPSTNSTYRQTGTSKVWIYWGGSMTDATNWSTPAVAWNPPGTVVPPIVVPPVTGSANKLKLMAWLQSINGKHVISSQMTHSDFREIDAMTSQLGITPGMVVCDPWMDGNQFFDASFVPRMIDHWNKKGIIGLSSFFPNPSGGGAQSGAAVNADDVLRSGSAANNNLLANVDLVAGVIQQFKDLGIPVMYRMLIEMDGGWFWWGDVTKGGAFNGAQYVQLWRLIWNRLVVVKKLDNMIFWFAPNGGPGTYTYPGDDVVDGVGFDAYTDNPGGYVNLYTQLRNQAPTKLMAICEFGSGTP